MRALFLLLLAAPVWAITLSSCTKIEGVHSVRIECTSDEAFAYTRVQYGSTASYGTTIGVDQYYGQSAGRAVCTISGLAAATAHHATCQVSADNSTWSAAVDVSFTTLADDGWEPTAPALPTDARTLPSVVGTPATATTCAELASMWASRTASDNTLYIDTDAINAAGCSTDDFPGGQLLLNNTDGARGWHRLSAIDLSTNTFTNAGHGLSNGNLIRFAGVNNYSYGYIPKGIDQAVDYYVIGVTTDTFQISLTEGGAAVDIAAAVAGASPTEVAYQSGAVPVPIYITSTLRASLPPAGVRVTAADAALMPTIKIRTTNANTPLIDLTMVPSPMVIRGIRFVPEAASTADTPGGDGATAVIRTGRAQRGFQLLHSIIEMPALYPHRVKVTVMHLDGADTTVADSRFVNLAQWRPWNRDIDASYTSTTAATDAGRYYLGHKICDVSAATFTRSGGGSSSAGAVAWMDPDCDIFVQVPTGWTGTCDNCTASNADTPAIPNSGGAYTVWALATYTTSGTAFTSATSVRMPMMGSAGESGSVISSSSGSRKLIDNNLFQECPGLPVFLSDAGTYDNVQYFSCADCDPIPRPSDYTVSRNDFILTDATRQPDTGSATLKQFTNRQCIESKDVTRFAVIGNSCTGNYRSLGNAGPAITLTPVTDGASLMSSRVVVKDALVAGNYIESAAGIVVTGRYPGGGLIGQVADRIMIRDNILRISDLVAPHSGTNPNAAFTLSSGPQRVSLERNTVTTTNPLGVLINPICQPATLRVNRNVMLLSDTASRGGFMANACAGSASSSPLNAAAYADDVWVNGFVAAGYQFTGNVLIAGYGTDGTTELDNSERATLAARQLSHTSPEGASIAARLAAASMQSDWTRAVGAAGGAREGIMNGARGLITGNATAIATGATTASVWWYAPSVTGCWVDYTDDDGATYSTPAQNESASRVQVQSLTGLTTATRYDIRVRCGGDTRTASIRTP